MPPELRTPSAVPVKRSGMLTVIFSPATSSWKSMWTMLRLTGWRWISRISVLRDLAFDAQLDDRAAGGELAEELFDFAGVDRERLRIAAVAVDDGRDGASLTNLAGDARAALGADVALSDAVAIVLIPD